MGRLRDFFAQYGVCEGTDEYKERREIVKQLMCDIERILRDDCGLGMFPSFPRKAVDPEYVRLQKSLLREALAGLSLEKLRKVAAAGAVQVGDIQRGIGIAAGFSRWQP